MNKSKDIQVLRDIIDIYERCAEPGIGMVVDIGFNEEQIKSLIKKCIIPPEKTSINTSKTIWTSLF